MKPGRIILCLRVVDLEIQYRVGLTWVISRATWDDPPAILPPEAGWPRRHISTLAFSIK